MKSQRLDMIEEYVLEHKNASLDTLCETFNVSKNTIRRDIDILLKRGTIMKVYGGVAALETPQALPLLSYEERGTRYPEEKKAICQRAADLVSEDDTIYIDTGTTCLNLVDYISDRHCTILTNSLLIFNKAAAYPNLDVISVPGRLNRKTLSFTGPDINDYLKTYNISRAFMACTGVTMKSGLTNASAEEYLTKKAIAENTASLVLLADHSKFGRISLMTYSSMDNLDAIVTDQKLPDEYDAYCTEHGIRVMTVG
nr:DeoR/GlpR family DNA-binding transcription regulator [uncultured Blautia sp.]